MGSSRHLAAAFALAVFAMHAKAGDHTTIEVLSSRADSVTGGDAVVRIHSRNVSKAKVRLNGADVTQQLVRDNASGTLTGVVSGLREGRNRLAVHGKGQNDARLTLVNHSIKGPVFSGPHQVPFVCTTERYGLGAPLDADCSAPGKTDYFYRSSATNSFRPLSDPSTRPADLATTTTTDGAVVDYIVRLETGVINRHVYWIATLDNPLAPVTRPWAADGRAPGNRWNRKLVYFFGGGCGYGFHQGTEAASVALIDDFLKLGYAVAHATNNTAGQNCNDVLSAESAMMVKERFIEQYGLPRYTTGFGGSGGAFQQRLIAYNYPGILDGLILQLPFPDNTTINARGLDCSLFQNYFAQRASNAAGWTPAKQAAATGFALDVNGRTMCSSIHPNLGQNKVNPRDGFDAVVSPSLRYDPVTNPEGARATVWDSQVNVFGIDRATGFARVTFDNVGVQYGLAGLNEGSLTKAEFLELNERIGGYSVDGDFVAARSTGNRTGIEIEYESGRVVRGDGLALPMIEIRRYQDDLADVHDRVWTFAMKARMLRDKGHTDNLVAWTYGRTVDQAFFTRLALQGMDDWLMASAKPGWLGDACWDAAGVKIDEEAVYNAPSRCNALYPHHKMPRMVAGGPLTNDVFKCELKRIDPRDYKVSFTPEEMARLKAMFPQGVCDWSEQGVEQRSRFGGTWQSFGP